MTTQELNVLKIRLFELYDEQFKENWNEPNKQIAITILYNRISKVIKEFEDQ